VPLPTDLALLKSRFLHRINGSDNGPAEQARRQKPRQPDVRRGFRISGKETQGESEESRILAQACRYYDITNPAIVLPLELEAVLLGDAIPVQLPRRCSQRIEGTLPDRPCDMGAPGCFDTCICIRASHEVSSRVVAISLVKTWKDPTISGACQIHQV
jgi:hypothetical protein